MYAFFTHLHSIYYTLSSQVKRSEEKVRKSSAVTFVGEEKSRTKLLRENHALTNLLRDC